MIDKIILNLYWDVKLALGSFDYLKLIDLASVERLVFVCSGNVCRSPYAESVAKLSNLSAISCGVDVKYSAPAEENAVRAALLRGLDLSSHMSQSIFDVQLKHFDCLVAMDPSHLPVVLKVGAINGCQSTLLGLWRQPPTISVLDPYGGSLQRFSNCYDMIDQALAGLKLALAHNQTFLNNQ